MIGFPHKDMKAVYSFITKQTHDRESKEEFQFPAEYMFQAGAGKDLVDVDDPISTTAARDGPLGDREGPHRRRR